MNKVEREKGINAIIAFILIGLFSYFVLFPAFLLFVLKYGGGGSHVDYGDEISKAYKIKRADKRVNPIFAGEVEPAIPDEDENNKTLAGIDTNKNGVRDDIDIYINRMSLNDNERMALRLLAQAYQEEILMPENVEMKTYHKVKDKQARAHDCWLSVSSSHWDSNNREFSPKKVLLDLILYSGSKRLNAFEAAGKGSSYTGKQLEGAYLADMKNCDFIKANH